MSVENIVGKTNYRIMGNMKVADRSSANVPFIKWNNPKAFHVAEIKLTFLFFTFEKPKC